MADLKNTPKAPREPEHLREIRALAGRIAGSATRIQQNPADAVGVRGHIQEINRRLKELQDLAPMEKYSGPLPSMGTIPDPDQ